MKRSFSWSSIIVLSVICLVMSGLLAVVNGVTAPVIKKAEDAKANGALAEVLPGGTGFEELDISEYTLPSSVTGVYRADGGHVFKTSVTGYSSGLQIMIGVNGAGEVTGTKVLSSSETLGAENTYGATTVGQTVATIDGLDTVAGATKTSTAFRQAVKDSLNASIILGGGTVDLRTPEEILKDSIAEVLPAAAGKDFEKVFLVEDLGEIKNVYKVGTDGYVVEFDGAYAGISNDGTVGVNNTTLSSDKLSTVPAILEASVLTDVDISGLEISDKITSVQKTASGNYVFMLKASGFGINGDAEYGISGLPIIVKTSVSADGVILDCLTVEQHESDGIGSVCENAQYYSKYAGRTEGTLDDIQIAGATYTANGYRTAVSKVFEAVRKLKEAGK